MLNSRLGTAWAGLLLVILGTASSCTSPHSSWDSLEPSVPTILARIVWRDSTGQEVSLESMRGRANTYRWFIEDRDRVPAEAVAAYERGARAGTEGRYPEALYLLWQAHRIAPGWLFPVYEAAWTYFLKGDLARAEKLYGWVDRMDPRGYWATKEALDCIHRERAGEYPRGAYEDYARLEWEERPARAAKLEALVRRAPTLAPAWKDLAVLRESFADRMNAVEKGLGARPDSETRGRLLNHEAALLAASGRTAEGDSIMKSLVRDPNTTIQTRAIAEALLASRPRGEPRQGSD